MFHERSRSFDRDIRAIHELITAGQSLEPVEQERL
jgi:hypothetical protein